MWRSASCSRFLSHELVRNDMYPRERDHASREASRMGRWVEQTMAVEYGYSVNLGIAGFPRQRIMENSGNCDTGV